MAQISSYPVKTGPEGADRLIGTDAKAAGSDSTRNFQLGDLQQAITGVANVKSAQYGAKGDGKSDDTAAIQQAVDASPTVYFPTGVYKVSGPINLPSGRVLYGDGMWTSVIQQTKVTYADTKSYYAALMIDGTNKPVSNIQLRDLGFIGENTSARPVALGFTPALLRISKGVSDVTVDRCRFEYSFGQGVQAYDSETNVRLTIRNCIANHNGETGINVSGYDFLITGNNCSGNAYAGYECVLTRGRFVANYAVENKGDGMAVGGYSDKYFPFPGGHFNVIQGNISVGNANHGLKIVVGTNHSIVSDNVCALNGLTGILVNEDGGIENGQGVTFTRFNTISGNTCISNGADGSPNSFGIHVTAPNNRIERNRCADFKITGYSQHIGILVTSPNCDILDNNVYNNVLRNYSFESGSAHTLFRVDQQEEPGKETFFDGSSTAKAPAKLTQTINANLTFGSIAPGGMAEQQVPVEGAKAADTVAVSPQQVVAPGLVWGGYVSNPGVVTVRISNMAAQPAVVAPKWSVAVIQAAS